MVIELVECVVKCLNAFPIDNGVTSTMHLDIIFKVKPKPHFNKKRIIFVYYAMVLLLGRIPSDVGVYQRFP